MVLKVRSPKQMHRLKSRCWQSYIPSGYSRGESISLPWTVSRKVILWHEPLPQYLNTSSSPSLPLLLSLSMTIISIFTSPSLTLILHLFSFLHKDTYNLENLGYPLHLKIRNSTFANTFSLYGNIFTSYEDWGVDIFRKPPFSLLHCSHVFLWNVATVESM